MSNRPLIEHLCEIAGIDASTVPEPVRKVMVWQAEPPLNQIRGTLEVVDGSPGPYRPHESIPTRPQHEGDPIYGSAMIDIWYALGEVTSVQMTPELDAVLVRKPFQPLDTQGHPVGEEPSTQYDINFYVIPVQLTQPQYDRALELQGAKRQVA